jgi:hypothetical protein
VSIQDEPVLNPWATADDALADVLAGLRRARMGALFAAAWGNAARFNVFQTMAITLAELVRGNYRFVALKDQSIPYQAPGAFEAAWAALPVGPEAMSLADMQQFLRGQGVEVAGDDITGLDVRAAEQFERDEFAAFTAQQEHPGAAVDGHHRADEIAFHGGAL